MERGILRRAGYVGFGNRRVSRFRPQLFLRIAFGIMRMHGGALAIGSGDIRFEPVVEESFSVLGFDTGVFRERLRQGCQPEIFF